MAITFKAVPEPSSELLTRVAAFQPENPFYTKGYTDSMRALGFFPFALFLEYNEELLTACTAFSKRGRINRRLEITSLPELADSNTFWTGLLKFCTESEISVLEINSFASNAAVIGKIPGEAVRKSRSEFQLDLGSNDLWQGVNRHHQRKIKKAKKAGLSLRVADDTQTCRDHARLANGSLDRRRSRGEIVGDGIRVNDAVAFTESHAGEIYQAVVKDEVLSSILVLKGAKGAYAQSSGTSDVGMQCGASQFLWYEIACHLQSLSMTVFNMGGADVEGVGLQEFKKGFGARRVDLESAEFYLGGIVKKTIGTVLNRLRGRI